MAEVKKEESTKKKPVSESKTEKTDQQEDIAVKTKQQKIKDDTPNPSAKAGKRSDKGQKEAKKKMEKIEKQIDADSVESKTDVKPKVLHKAPRSRLERRSKKYREAAKLIDIKKQYGLKEALDLAIKTSTTKFNPSVEMHIRLNVDPKQADQNIRDNVVLPSGTGKTVRIAVYSDEQNVSKAKKAGADIAASDEFLTDLDKGKIDFDVLIATPNVMQKLAKYARVLGPKGLMPNPKSGTVTANVESAIKQAKAGKIEYRVDSYGIVHAPIGKAGFGVDKLLTNAQALLSSIKQNKPGSLKGTYVNSITVTTSMGPGVKVLNSEL